MAKFIDKLDHAMRSCDLQNFNYSSFVVENYHRYWTIKEVQCIKTNNYDDAKVEFPRR